MSWLLVFVPCLAGGLVLRATGLASVRTARLLNQLIVSVFLPALTLLQIHELRLEPALLVGGFPLWIVMAGALVLFPVVGRLRGWTPRTIGCLILTAGLGNTLFVGLPA